MVFLPSLWRDFRFLSLLPDVSMSSAGTFCSRSVWEVLPHPKLSAVIQLSTRWSWSSTENGEPTASWYHKHILCSFSKLKAWTMQELHLDCWANDKKLDGTQKQKIHHFHPKISDSLRFNLWKFGRNTEKKSSAPSQCSGFKRQVFRFLVRLIEFTCTSRCGVITVKNESQPHSVAFVSLRRLYSRIQSPNCYQQRSHSDHCLVCAALWITVCLCTQACRPDGRQTQCSLSFTLIYHLFINSVAGWLSEWFADCSVTSSLAVRFSWLNVRMALTRVCRWGCSRLVPWLGS